MRTSKELILATKAYTKEDRFRSWFETWITILLLSIFFTATFVNFYLPLRLLCSVMVALLYVRMFVIYHDYQHHAILQNSKLATVLMKAFGIFILVPQTIWKRSHDHHHNHNSKLTITGIGSYPTICKNRFLNLTKTEQRIYLINRHPLTVIFGYFTLFIYWLNIKSFVQSPKRHLDSLFTLLFHFIAGGLIWYFLGFYAFLISWFIPYFLAFAIGSYLFYSQHNFPGAEFKENQDWKYEHAALSSTSYMVMPAPLQWMTGNIGYHHVHHLNSRIPFYRLPEAMKSMPELHSVYITSWHPVEMWRCFRLKLWDADKGKMITMSQI
ncbi:MAG TPA: fatty acid desaturase [Cytophagales bacterium]|nr:fatty acid desaturase [Cytophagales bacterium]